MLWAMRAYAKLRLTPHDAEGTHLPASSRSPIAQNFVSQQLCKLIYASLEDVRSMLMQSVRELRLLSAVGISLKS
jgi:hypothetical protein